MTRVAKTRFEHKPATHFNLEVRESRGQVGLKKECGSRAGGTVSSRRVEALISEPTGESELSLEFAAIGAS